MSCNCITKKKRYKRNADKTTGIMDTSNQTNNCGYGYSGVKLLQQLYEDDYTQTNIQAPQKENEGMSVVSEGRMAYTKVKDCKCWCGKGGMSPVPEPPPGVNSDLWDLQFCRWWGWNWVRKQEEMAAKQRSVPRKPMRTMNEHDHKETEEPRTFMKPTNKKKIHESFQQFCNLCKNFCTINKNKNNRLERNLKKDLQGMYDTPCSSVVFENCKCNRTVSYTLQGDMNMNSARPSSLSTVMIREESRRKRNKISKCKTQSWVKDRSESSSSDECHQNVVRARKPYTRNTGDNLEYLSMRMESVCEKSSSSSSNRHVCGGKCCGCEKKRKVIRICCCHSDKIPRKTAQQAKPTQTKPACTCDKQLQAETCMEAKQVQTQASKKKERKHNTCVCEPVLEIECCCCCNNRIVGCECCPCEKQKKNPKTTNIKSISSKETQCDNSLQASSEIDKKRLAKDYFCSPLTGQIYHINVPALTPAQIKYDASERLPKMLNVNDDLNYFKTTVDNCVDGEHKKLLTAVCDAIFKAREKITFTTNNQTKLDAKSCGTVMSDVISPPDNILASFSTSQDIKLNSIVQNIMPEHNTISLTSSTEIVERKSDGICPKKRSSNDLHILSPRNTITTPKKMCMTKTGLFTAIPETHDDNNLNFNSEKVLPSMSYKCEQQTHYKNESLALPNTETPNTSSNNQFDSNFISNNLQGLTNAVSDGGNLTKLLQETSSNFEQEKTDSNKNLSWHSSASSSLYKNKYKEARNKEKLMNSVRKRASSKLSCCDRSSKFT